LVTLISIPALLLPPARTLKAILSTIVTLFASLLWLFTQFHGQTDAFAGDVYLYDLYFDNIAGFDDFAGVGGEFVAELADVDQAVLMDT
jgi:hypothetical protein